MKLLKSPLRRTTAILAGAFLGMAGAVAIAAPASAHSPSVTGDTPCLSGDSWTIDWSVGNDYRDDATVGAVFVTDRRGDNLSITGPITDEGVTVPARSANRPGAQVHGSTTVSNRVVQAAVITVVLVWPDGYTNDGKDGHINPVTYTVRKPAKCATPEPTPTQPTPTVPTPSDIPSDAPSDSPSDTPSESPSAPPTPELPVPTPSTSASEPDVFTPIIDMTCDTITIGMDNPAGGVEWQMHFKTSKGEERDLTIAPGEKKSEKFSATAGFTVTVTLTVTFEGETYSDFTTVDFQKPGDCSGEGGGLPVTGAAAGTIAGGAAVLLAIGGVLFFMARRRKVKFTA